MSCYNTDDGELANDKERQQCDPDVQDCKMRRQSSQRLENRMCRARFLAMCVRFDSYNTAQALEQGITVQ